MNIEALGDDYKRCETLSLDTRQNLADLLGLHAKDLTEPVVDILRRSDKYVELAQNGLYRLPLLSTVNGYEFVAGLVKKEVHNYAYSDQFDIYRQQITSLTDHRGDLERHFFTHGVAIGVLLKHHRDAE